MVARSFSVTMVYCLLFGVPLAAQDLSPEALASVVANAAREMERGYVFPDLGSAVADSLRGRLARGIYAGILDRAALAIRLTTDLRELSNDRHASIFVDEPPAAHTPVRQRSVSRVDILPDSVGYLRVEEFDEDLYSRLPTLMSQMAAVPALIIDIRDCPGGDGGVMLALAGYLLPQRTRLGSLYSRRDSSTTDIWTEEPKGARFMDRPVYILTSRSTFSAAEAFAYHIQAFGRVIVVGDTTGGGAHRVHDVDLGENMQMALPYTCVMNAVTGTDWEGIGVIPNVCASPDEALDAARKEAERARRGATRH